MKTKKLAIAKPPTKVSPMNAGSRSSRLSPRTSSAGRAGRRFRGSQRLRQHEPGQEQAERRGERQHAEDQPPAPDQHQPAAGERRQHRRDRDHQHHHRHQPRRLRPAVQVADDRPRDHHHRGGADPLHQPRRDQRPDRRRKRAAERADEEDREPDIERRLAPELVRQRPIDELRHAESGEERRQRELRRLRRGAEIGRHLRQRRQVHVDRERPDRAEQPDHQRNAEHSDRRSHHQHHLSLLRAPRGPTSTVSRSPVPSIPRRAPCHG